MAFGRGTHNILGCNRDFVTIEFQRNKVSLCIPLTDRHERAHTNRCSRDIVRLVCPRKWGSGMVGCVSLNPNNSIKALEEVFLICESQKYASICLLLNFKDCYQIWYYSDTLVCKYARIQTRTYFLLSRSVLKNISSVVLLDLKVCVCLHVYTVFQTEVHPLVFTRTKSDVDQF